MFGRTHGRGWHYPLLLGIGAALFLTNLGGASLWDLDEGRNATAAFEMMESGNYIVPTFNGLLRVDKPALLYWLQIGAYRTFGVNEFAARLPSALAALGVMLVAYELGRRLFSRSTGLLAGVVVASTPMLCGAARFANPDALLNVFTALTLALFWRARTHPRYLTFVGAGVAAGMAVLAKGPVGFVLPATVIGLFLLWERRWDELFRRGWLHSVAAMLIVALPWYAWVALETKANFLHGFIMGHNVDRFLSPMENHRGSPLYYPLVLLVGLAPWSIFAGPAAWFAVWSAVRTPWPRYQAWWQGASESAFIPTDDDRRDAAGYRFLLCWIATYLVFFTIAATKLPNYVLPLSVPCALLLARFLDRWRLGELKLPGWLTGFCLACLPLIGVALTVGLTIVGGVGDLAILRGRHIRGLETWAVMGIVPVIGAMAAVWCWRTQRRGGVVASVAATAVLLLGPLAAFGSAVFNAVKVPRPLVEEAGAWRPMDEIRVGGWKLEHLPSLNFYVGREVHHMQDADQARAYLEAPMPSYLFLRADDWDALAGTVRVPYRVVGRGRDLYKHGEVVVVTNRE